ARARAPGDRAALRLARPRAADAGGGWPRLRRHARAHPPDREQHAAQAQAASRGPAPARPRLRRAYPIPPGGGSSVLFAVAMFGLPDRWATNPQGSRSRPLLKTGTP